MRVYPINVVKNENCSCRKPLNKPNFKSVMTDFIPKDIGEAFVSGTIFTAIVCGIYYLGLKILSQIEAYMKNLSDEVKNTSEKEEVKQ